MIEANRLVENHDRDFCDTALTDPHPVFGGPAVFLLFLNMDTDKGVGQGGFVDLFLLNILLSERYLQFDGRKLHCPSAD